MTIQRRLHLVYCDEAFPRLPQSDCSNAFGVIEGGRTRRRRSDADVMRADLPVLWQRFVQHLFGYGPGARSETAIFFGVTLQTACNWHDGVVGPMGHAVAHAAKHFPAEFNRLICGAEIRIAA